MVTLVLLKIEPTDKYKAKMTYVSRNKRIKHANNVFKLSKLSTPFLHKTGIVA